jgi:hypothetical protein
MCPDPDPVMRLASVLLCLLAASVAGTARAQENPVVVELYTSQGCSSCPPADALLPRLAEIPGVIALALHVDYWDYLGWQDTFGKRQYSNRQHAFSKKLRHRRIFTPQVVVQGQDVLVGHQAGKIIGSLEAHLAEPSPVGLEVSRDGSALDVAVTPEGDVRGPLDLHLVSFIPSTEVAIGSGENAGHTMTYTHVVTGWRTVATWDGREPMETRIEDVPAGPVVVIVQQAETGPVVTAAQLP